MVVAQDLPPKGGYDSIQWKRNLPSRGFRPSIYLAILGVTSFLGFIPFINGIRERRELTREKIWARAHILPLLQAEIDRDTVRRHYATVSREKELTQGLDGWEDGKPIFNDDKIHLPSFVSLEGVKKA
ncbi:GRIM-19 [Lipomyces japonicus]|uniref:GRIM-19 n=1 Tax=Lipomyces japonicus TaxID=56871 RepID=UPI0034CF7879